MSRILVIDIETSPLLSFNWGTWEQNAVAVKDDWQILSFAAKWVGESKVTVLGQNTKTEKELVKAMWTLLDEAEVAVAHNGNRFDFKKINSKCLKYGMRPPCPYKTIDTLKVVKRYFALNSNRLNDVGKFLEVGEKMKHQGIQLWLDCMNKDKKAWRKMLAYNKQDILLLEKVYLILRPWITNHPNASHYGDAGVCPKCGSKHSQSRGLMWVGGTQQRRFMCVSCGGWYRMPLNKERPVMNIV